MKLTKEQKNAIIKALSEVGLNHDSYEYGLPCNDEGQMALMREAIDEVLADE